VKYYKHIEIDNYQTIRENSVRFVLDKYLVKTHSSFRQFDWNLYVQYCPEIVPALAKYDLVPYGGFVYTINSQDSSPLHIDYISDIYNKCRINIPIFNCEHSKTFYYKKIDKDVQGTSVTQSDIMFYSKESDTKTISYMKFDPNDPGLEKVDEMIVDRPTVIRVQEPHRVMIDSNHVPRVVLTIHTYKDPVYLLEDEND
jgi:hypothetical protein